MNFTTSELDLAVPLALRALLAGWRPGALRPRPGFAGKTQLSAAHADALIAACASSGLLAIEGDAVRRTTRAVRLFVADLGGTKLHAALVDETGAILVERVEPTAPGADAVLGQIARLRDELAAQIHAGPTDILAAAMGVPGAVDPRSGRIRIATNIAGLEGIDFAAALRSRLGHPVRLDNDVNLAALGERAAGIAQGRSDFAFVALGTGIGMGLVLGDRLVRGHRGMAGEIALLPVATAGASGAALEDLIGNTGILAAARQRGETQAATVKDLFAEARAGGVAARSAIDATVQTLFSALLAVHAVADPGLIVLGGSIGLQPEIAEALSALAGARSFTPRIAVSALGARATLAGASLAALAALVAGTSHEAATMGATMPEFSEAALWN